MSQSSKGEAGTLRLFPRFKGGDHVMMDAEKIGKKVLAAAD
jgi:hypothetical protein